jgi:hypothetical protein
MIVGNEPGSVFLLRTWRNAMGDHTDYHRLGMSAAFMADQLTMRIYRKTIDGEDGVALPRDKVKGMAEDLAEINRILNDLHDERMNR